MGDLNISWLSQSEISAEPEDGGLDTPGSVFSLLPVSLADAPVRVQLYTCAPVVRSISYNCLL